MSMEWRRTACPTAGPVGVARVVGERLACPVLGEVIPDVVQLAKVVASGDLGLGAIWSAARVAAVVTAPVMTPGAAAKKATTPAMALTVPLVV